MATFTTIFNLRKCYHYILEHITLLGPTRKYKKHHVHLLKNQTHQHRFSKDAAQGFIREELFSLNKKHTKTLDVSRETNKRYAIKIIEILQNNPFLLSAPITFNFDVYNLIDLLPDRYDNDVRTFNLRRMLYHICIFLRRRNGFLNLSGEIEYEV